MGKTGKEIRVITPVVNGPDISGVFEAEISRTARNVPDIRVSQSIVEAGTPSIESEYDEVLCAPHALALAIAAERDGVDAVVIDCMSDPALRAMREALDIPVIGPAQAAMHTASLVAETFGILMLNEDVAPIHKKLARLYGFEGKLATLGAAGIHADQIRGMMRDDPAALFNALSRTALDMLTQDAQAIVLGCTGFLGCAAHIRTALEQAGAPGVPVIDPIPNAIMAAAMLCDLGLSQSKRSFPRPAMQPVSGYPDGWGFPT